MIPAAFAEQAVILTTNPGAADALGNPTPGTPTQTTTSGVYAPEGSTELIQGQETVLDHPRFYLSPGAPVPTAQDRLLIRGETFDIDGTPAVFHNPFTGEQPGAVVKLLRVTG